MAEPRCICGHSREQHDEYSACMAIHSVDDEPCHCDEFRAEPTPAPGNDPWTVALAKVETWAAENPLTARDIGVHRLLLMLPAALPVAAPPAVTPQLADAVKMLTLLGNPCPKNAQGDDHDWHECPRCEMLHELEMRGSLARRLMLTAAAALGGPNS